MIDDSPFNRQTKLRWSKSDKAGGKPKVKLICLTDGKMHGQKKVSFKKSLFYLIRTEVFKIIFHCERMEDYLPRYFLKIKMMACLSNRKAANKRTMEKFAMSVL